MSSKKIKCGSPPAKQGDELAKTSNIPNSKLDVNRIHDDTLPLSAITEHDAEKLEQEARHLTNMDIYLPDLVWKHVLKKMNKLADIKNCSNASPYFGKILKQKRSEKIVLPKVFQILSRRYADEYNKDKSYREPIANPHLMTGFWKCRLVSKSWNKAIEELHQSLENESTTLSTSGHLLKWSLAHFEPTTERSPIRFCAHFSDTHYDNLNDKLKKNPFLGGMILIYLPSFDSNNETMAGYLRSASEMLRKYGGEIWCCFFLSYLPQHAMHHLNLYRRIIELVNLLPNLKLLFLKCLDDIDPNLRTLGIEIIVDEAQLGMDLEREMAEIEFPFLPNLKLVTFDNLSRVVVGQIRLHNSHAIFNEK